LTGETKITVSALKMTWECNSNKYCGWR